MARRRRSILTLCLLTSSLFPAIGAIASETVTYRYDERGRLVKVNRSGTVNNGVSACYAYDKADNRNNVTVATSWDCSTQPPSFSINDASATEGGNLVFTVTKTGTTSASLSINYATANGTATAGSDYTAITGTLTFAPADVTKTITIATIDDAAVESAETVLVNLSGATGGATISDTQGIGTINDNDVAPTCGGISFTVASNAAVTEGAGSVFTVTKAGSTSNSCSVNYATANGTAIAGSDYTTKSGTLTFTSAQTSQTVSVTTTDDATVESAETFTMALSSPTGGSTVGSPGSATATINDNDVAPTCGGVSFTVASNAAVTEGASSGFTVTKAGTTSNSCSVNYATANGTATAGSDYTAKSGTLTFTTAQTSQTVSVTTTDDTSVESSETFSMNLSSPTGGSTVGTPGTATATINDNDVAPTCGGVSFRVLDAGNEEGVNLSVSIAKDGSATGSCSVSYATANNTAVAPGDYTPKSLTAISFAANETTKTVAIFLAPDSLVEAPETFFVNLSNPTGGATISDAQGIETIIDATPEQCFDENGQPIPCP